MAATSQDSGATDPAHSTRPPRPPLARALLRGSLPWTLALFAALNLATAQGHERLLRRHQENLLAVPTDPSREIRFDYSYGEDLAKYWGHIPDAKKVRLVIVAGMSQMYSVNNTEPGDQIIAEWIDDALRGLGNQPRASRAFGLAAPNLDNEEGLFLLLATLSDPSTRPDAFVFGVCFDKFRNVDLRPGYLRFLRSRPELQALIARTIAAQEAAHPLAAAKLKASLDAALAAEKTDANEASLEGRLRGATAAVLPVVADRTALNAVLQENAYNLRNYVFRIKPTTKRPQLPSRYQLNQDLLSLLADVARANGVHLLPYVIPLNALAENPYVTDEYRQFKDWYAELVREKGLPLVNLENLVPAEEWGTRDGEVDFKHFRGLAHHRTATAILAAFGDQLLGPARP